MGFLKTLVAINRGVVFFIVALGIQLSAKQAMAEPLAIGFSLPTSQYINNVNAAKLGLGGSCSNPAAQIDITLGKYGNASAVCQDDKTWSVTNLNAVDWADGKVVLKASYTSNPSVYASREFSKDTVNPIVNIVYPANGTVFTAKNLKPVAISGICNGGSVLVRVTDSVGKAIEDPLVCGASRLFSTSMDFSAFKDGDLKLVVTNTSPSGNVATASSSYLKSTTPVTVSISSLLPYINIENAAKHAFQGKCTANGGMIFLDMFSANNSSVPAQSLIASCIDTKWSIPNVSFASDLFPDGNVTVTVGHINITTGESAQPAKLALKKVTTPVEVKIATPANGYIMNTVTGPKLQVSGSCSINEKPVRIGYIIAKTSAFKSLAAPKCTLGSYLADVDFSALADGVITLSVQQADDVANIGRQDLSFSKKMKLPQLTLASSSSIVNIGNVAIMKLSGQCSEYADLGQQVTIETVPAMPAQPLFAICQKPLRGKGLGTWSLPNISFTAVPNGTLKVIAKHSDFAGNVVQASLDLEKDTLQPTLTITMPALGKDEHFLINAANASSPISIGGECNKPGAKITAKNVAPTVETTCTSLKTWNVQLDFSKVPDGKSLVENFSIVDSVGNVATQSLGFDKKTVLPVITIAKPLPASILNISNAHILDVTGSCSEFDDLGMAVNVQLGSIKQQAICVKGTYFVQMSANALENGTLMLTVSQTDYVGNTGSVSINLIKDTLQPTLTITQPKLGKGEHFVINSANVSKPVVVAGDCNKPGAKIVARDVAPEVITACGVDKKWSVSLDFKGVKDGKSLVENFTIIDSADNRATQSIGFDKKVTLPTITIASPREGEYLSIANVHILEVKGTCSEYGELGTNVNLSLGTVKATAVCNGGSYLVQMSGTALADGAVKLIASQTDYIGNTATVSVNLVKSTKMPTLTITSPSKDYLINDSNASAVPFAGTCSENGRLIEMSGAVKGSATCLQNKWSLKANASSLANGMLGFTFTHKDVAGNAAVQTISLQKMVNGCDISIASAADLSKTTSYKNRKVCLINDILLTGSNQPDPITLEKGEFDGRGFMIRGFVHGTKGALFKSITKAKLSNLVLDSVVIKAEANTSASVALLVNQLTNGQVENVRVQNISLPSPLAAWTHSTCGLVAGFARDSALEGVSVEFGKLSDLGCETFGGVVGVATNVNFKNIQVNGSYSGKARTFGGLAGDLRWWDNTLMLIDGAHVALNADIGSNGPNVGGFFGYAHHWQRYKVVNSSFAGSLNGSLYVGGITGSGGSSEEFRNVSVRATLSKGTYMGGLIGSASWMYAGSTPGSTIVDSSEIIVKMSEVGSGNGGYIGGITPTLQHRTLVTNSKIDIEATSDGWIHEGVFAASSGLYVGFADNVRVIDGLSESGNDYRGSFSPVYSSNGKVYKYGHCFTACYGSEGVPSFENQSNTLVINGTPRSPVDPILSGYLSTPVAVGEDLLVSGSVQESNMTSNLAGVLISIGTSASDRRVLGFVDSKTPSDGKFQFLISKSILLNCNGAWDCSKMRVFAEGIDRTGKVTELAAQSATGLGN